ncbi:hypothetical protein HMPREF1505_1728 [Prevotella sp. ICM33]|nr:hypothetical protein HMPREF1505_1728 [Prevotella sp. ICM33]
MSSTHDGRSAYPSLPTAPASGALSSSSATMTFLSRSSPPTTDRTLHDYRVPRDRRRRRARRPHCPHDPLIHPQRPHARRGCHHHDSVRPTARLGTGDYRRMAGVAPWSGRANRPHQVAHVTFIPGCTMRRARCIVKSSGGNKPPEPQRRRDQ